VYAPTKGIRKLEEKVDKTERRNRQISNCGWRFIFFFPVLSRTKEKKISIT
jgi:hypothetical protein